MSEYVIEIPEVPRSLNILGSGSRWTYIRLKRHWQAMLLHEVGRQQIERTGYVYVEGEMTFPDRHKRDQGNFRFIVEKALGDALQQAGVIADDDWDSYEFGGLSKSYEKGVSRTRLLLMADWT
jgi:hypothetical protein